MNRRMLMLLGAAGLALASIPAVLAQETQLKVIVFPGMANLPILAAETQGFFAKRGLRVEMIPTPNSTELRNGLAEGRYDIAHAGNLIAQPEINSISDLKGKTVGVDAPNTAFALVLYAMLKQKGVNRGEYTVKPIGGSLHRMNAIKNDKSIAATMLNVPFSLMAVEAGLKDLGSATKAIGPYQGTGGFVLRAWAQKNSDLLVRYTQAYIEGLRWMMTPANREAAIKLLVERVKLPPHIAAQAYAIQTDPVEGLPKDAAFNLEGFRNVLKLRAEFEGGTSAPPSAITT